MLGAGAGSALLYWGFARLGVSPWIAAVPVAGGMALALSRDRSDDAPRRLALLGFRALFAFAGLACLLTLHGYAGLAGLGAGLGLALAAGDRGLRAPLVAVAGALGAMFALEVGFRIASSAELASMPGWLLATTAGAGFGLTLAVPIAARHIAVIGDPVSRRYPTVRDCTGGEIQELVIRGYGIWGQARPLPETDDNRRLLEEAVLKLFDTAEKWGASAAEKQPRSVATLAERMSALEERIAATSDEQVKREYQQAHDALAEQRKHLAEIDNSRQRVIARMHNYLAAMERLQLAAVNLRSSSASRDTAAVADTLAEIGRDMT